MEAVSPLPIANDVQRTMVGEELSNGIGQLDEVRYDVLDWPREALEASVGVSGQDEVAVIHSQILHCIRIVG